MIFEHDFDSFLAAILYERSPEQMLLIKILERAFWDALGANADIASAEGRRNSRITAKLFLRDKFRTEFGTASEMSVSATGSVWFVRKLIEFIEKGDYANMKDGTRKNFFYTKEFNLTREVCHVK